MKKTPIYYPSLSASLRKTKNRKKKKKKNTKQTIKESCLSSYISGFQEESNLVSPKLTKVTMQFEPC